MQSGGHRYSGTDPNFMLREFYLTDGDRNLNDFTDPEVDRLFSEQNLESDPGARRGIVNQIEHIVLSFYGNPVLTSARRTTPCTITSRTRSST